MSGYATGPRPRCRGAYNATQAIYVDLKGPTSKRRGEEKKKEKRRGGLKENGGR